MSIKIVQSNEKRKGEDRWDWEVHLEGNDEDLNEIEYVEYTLHETFPNPVRRIYDRTSRFELKTSGWGTFILYVRIQYKEEKRRDDFQEVPLRFDQPAATVEL